MIVAGPNSRLDFHVKMGEALYYQLKRLIDLDIIDSHSSRERITIKEDDVLPHCWWVALPSKVPRRKAYPVALDIAFWKYLHICKFVEIIYNGTCTPTLFNRNSSLHAVSLNGDLVEHLHYWLEVNFSFLNHFGNRMTCDTLEIVIRVPDLSYHYIST